MVNTELMAYKDFPRFLKKNLAKHGMNNAELAKKLGVTRQSISLWTKGRVQPLVIHIEKTYNFFKSLEE